MEELEFVSCSRREGYDSVDDPVSMTVTRARYRRRHRKARARQRQRTRCFADAQDCSERTKQGGAGGRGSIYACGQKGEMDGLKEVKDG